MKAKKTQAAGCPGCHGRSAYRLADGRKKCRSCGRRYSVGRSSSRLSARLVRQLSLSFWHLVPAEQAAAELRLNRKTVQRHYRLIRQAISDNGERGENEGGEVRGFSGCDEPVATLTRGDGGVQVVFSPEALSSGQHGARQTALLFAASVQALERCDLSEFKIALPHEGLNRDDAEAFLPFWRFAQRLARMRPGGTGHDFRLFMREAAFRFNQRNNPEVIADLSRLLR